ncbi:dipeptide/oligopeptide/nickel ABC transporter permease/ATP-binding protein [Arthrobacter zhaoguopingii]|uniref:dipeptide/oligopeptide/nickel ABC transporter permease/ATP-binding protein n=1 Tax=Arthrobacter zhaoguopingii TaxID=2681491 RepID=UPI00135BD0E3|nr:dipeptide/oligopeptide/nickel ABC transporter permease/ATP-binding protein [Arthrobacter zhaoguopingii]
MATTSIPGSVPATRAVSRSSASARWLAVLRTPVGATAGLLLIGFLALSIIAPPLWGDDANAVDTDSILQGPSAEHLVGTDNLGRDLFLRVLVASASSIQLALLATGLAVMAGVILGSVPLLVGPRLGRLITSAINIAIAFPGLLLALFFAVIFGVGSTGAVLAIGAAGAPSFARLMLTLTASVIERDYVSAARIAGVGRVRILLRHVLPNIGEPLVVNATIGAGGALLAFASLSFLGLGVQPPAYDWGQLLNTGLNSIYRNPAAAFAPGIAVVLAGLAFNMLGESIAQIIGAPTIRSGSRTHRRRELRAASHPLPPEESRSTTSDRVLDVVDLSVTFPGADGPVRPVRGINLTVQRGEAVGIVGESGSGKSLTALAIARLIEEPGQVDAERLEFLGVDLLSGSEREHRDLLGTSLAVVFQDPMTSFNPTQRMGRQLAEVAEQHQGMNRRHALLRAIDRLRAVRVPTPALRAQQYPHQFSGGMRQRAMIGMGLMGSPALIIADEPTTALDPTVQQQVLRLLASIRRADDVAILLISHDVSVVAELCGRVVVMYAGQIVEDLPAAELTTRARHPYTRALIAAVPTMRTDLGMPLNAIPGLPVDPAHVPVGCPYSARCPRADDHCRDEDPPLVADAAGRRVACWHADELEES